MTVVQSFDPISGRAISLRLRSLAEHEADRMPKRGRSAAFYAAMYELASSPGIVLGGNCRSDARRARRCGP